MKWISVKERLPEATPATMLKHASDSENVLFYLNDGWDSMVTGFYCHNKKRWWTADASESYMKNQVTHWQPLPDPPEDE